MAESYDRPLWIDVSNESVSQGFDNNGFAVTKVNFPMSEGRKMEINVPPTTIDRSQGPNISRIQLGGGATEYTGQIEYPDGRIIDGTVNAKSILDNYNSYFQEMYASQMQSSAKTAPVSDKPEKSNGFLARIRGMFKHDAGKDVQAETPEQRRQRIADDMYAKLQNSPAQKEESVSERRYGQAQVLTQDMLPPNYGTPSNDPNTPPY